MNKPIFIVIAGANGAGKSTLTQSKFPLFSSLPVLDPDAIARNLVAITPKGAPLAAGREVIISIERYLAEKLSFSVETTLSGKNYLRTMTTAREQGYYVALIYIGTESVEVNLERVANRVQRGGHHVPETDVRRRYVRSFQTLPLAMARADEAVLFDNSNLRGYQFVGHGNPSKFEWFEPLPRWAIDLKKQIAN